MKQTRSSELKQGKPEIVENQEQSNSGNTGLRYTREQRAGTNETRGSKTGNTRRLQRRRLDTETRPTGETEGKKRQERLDEEHRTGKETSLNPRTKNKHKQKTKNMNNNNQRI